MDAWLSKIADPDGFGGISTMGWMFMAGTLVFGVLLLKISKWHEGRKTYQRQMQYESSELGRESRDVETAERRRRREEVTRELEHYEQGRFIGSQKTRKAVHSGPNAPTAAQGTPGQPVLKPRRKTQR